MPVWAYTCSKCGQMVTMSFSSSGVRDLQEATGLMCSRIPCAGTLQRQPAAPNFAMRGFSAKNGYSN